MEDLARTHGAAATTHIAAPTGDDRVLVVAPHPDDETLGTGGLLAAAAAARAMCRVVFLTDGENNPWAQRAREHRLRIRAGDRLRFGALRRTEALRALSALGLTETTAAWMGLPDQGLTELLTTRPEAMISALAAEARAFAPTIVAGPSALDLHPDHSAAAVALSLALGRLDVAPLVLAYLVHNPSLRHKHYGLELHLGQGGVGQKGAAIEAHASQLVLRSGLLRSFSAPVEHFLPRLVNGPGSAHPVQELRRERGGVTVVCEPRWRLRAFGARSLLLLHASGSDVRALRVALPLRPGPALLVDLASGEEQLAHSPASGRVLLPEAQVPPEGALVAKLDRSIGFFDEAGWCALQGILR